MPLHTVLRCKYLEDHIRIGDLLNIKNVADIKSDLIVYHFLLSDYSVRNQEFVRDILFQPTKLQQLLQLLSQVHEVRSS
jgi:hypothetical protein